MLDSVRRVFLSTSFMGVALFLFAAAFPPFDDASEVDLSIHMLQHVAIILAGVAVAYPLYKKGRFEKLNRGWLKRLSLLVVAAAILYWHLPGPWDAAVLNPLIHASEHGTFFAVGLIIGSVLMYLSNSAKIEALLAAFFAHMVYAVILLVNSSVPVYSLYSIGDQFILGLSLLLTGPTLLLGVAYVLLRDPGFLQRLGGEKPPTTVEPKREWKAPRLPRFAALTVSILLVVTSAAYFGYTAVAIGTVSSSPKQGAAIVYIAETPVSWQYSPQDLVVQLGVNSTVNWVSHSVSYDTVTSMNGTFASGTIAPGATFSFTFTKPGVYPYYCVYHPWMVGKITVLTAPLSGSQN